MVRGEQPVWIVDAARRDAERFGMANATLTVLLYLVFYGSLCVTPYIILSIPLVNASEAQKERSRLLRRITSVWIAFSLALFHRSIFAFLRAYPSGSLWEWGIVIWCVGSALLLLLWWTIVVRAEPNAALPEALSPSVSEPRATGEFGSENVIFTKEAADAARERIRKRLRDKTQ
jgi:hypothetical protein